MKLTKNQLADILVADQARWQARVDAENAPTETSRAALESYHCETPLLRGTGMILPPRKYPRAPKRDTVRGAATMPPDSDAAERLAAGDVEPTVLCYNANDPANATVRTVASFRKTRERKTTRTTTTARTPETARFSHGHNFND